MRFAAPIFLLLAAALAGRPLLHAQDSPPGSDAAPSPPAADAPAAAPGAVCADAWRVPIAGLGDDAADYARAAEITGLAPVRSRVARRPSAETEWFACPGIMPWAHHAPGPTGGFRADVVPLRIDAYRNSDYPRNRNTGTLWAGRGVSAGMEAGVRLRWGPISAGLVPAVSYQENRGFDLAPRRFANRSDFAYAGHRGIDWPQRFGDEPFWTVDPGQSFFRIDAYGFAAGISNENLWWGPARRNPILLSNTAPGFPHVFIGTGRAHDIWIGRLEAETFWGRLDESDYFDQDPDNDRRLLAGLVLVLEPRGLPGLYIGGGRLFSMYVSDELALGDYFLEPFRELRGNPREGPLRDNQILSLFFRWALPASGFEVYAEWGRNDHWMNTRDLILEPDHAQVFLGGFQKVVPSGDRWFRLWGELNYLQTSAPTRGGRSVTTVYTHSQVVQGHTHRGQLLGGAIGPGSNAQALGLDLFTTAGRSGVFFERVRYDADAYYAHHGRWYGPIGHDVELTGGLSQLLFWRDFELTAALAYSLRYNRNFLGLDGVNFEDFRVDHNLLGRFGLSWRPGVRRVPLPPRTSVSDGGDGGS